MSERSKSDDLAQTPPTPERLIEALRALSPPPSVPQAIDDSVLRQARAHLNSAKPDESRGPNVISFPQWLAVAAALVLGMGLVFFLRPSRTGEPMMAREDIDRNGHVDILDAFALARKLQAGRITDSAFDANGDGVIDQRDIDWIAARAVRLTKS